MEKIPFLSLESIHNQVNQEILSVVNNIIKNNIFINGPYVKAFEMEFAKLCNVKYAVGTSNGLDALIIALITLGIGKNDEVLVPSNTFIATILAITHVGATPIFIEPDIHTYNLDPTKIEVAITKKTKVIIPVHLYGQSCEMDKIMSIARKYKLFVIEDNAQAHLSLFKGKITGSWGDINATSFYPGKNLGAMGDAGALTTNSSDLALKANTLKNYGSIEKYKNIEMGYNKRMDELQAGVLTVKINKLIEWTNSRQLIANEYNFALKNVGDIITPQTHLNATHSYHLYVIRTKFRDELRSYLVKKGIETSIHYPIPPHLQQAYKHLGYKEGDFPISEELSKTSLSIPLWPGMQGETKLVINEIKRFYEKNS